MNRPTITGMRVLLVTGVLIVAVGAFILLADPRVHSEGEVHVGPFHSTVHEQHTVPPLFGWIAVVGGVLLAVAGGLGERRKR